MTPIVLHLLLIEWLAETAGNYLFLRYLFHFILVSFFASSLHIGIFVVFCNSFFVFIYLISYVDYDAPHVVLSLYL